MLTVERLNTLEIPAPDALVQVKKMGGIFEVRSMLHAQKPPILKISKDYYLNLSEESGEVHEFQHGQSRADNLQNVKQSLRKLRDLLNANVVNPSHCRWLTLTYKDNMQDTARLYDDFRKFNQRFQYYCRKSDFPEYQYIVAMEPQGRGAWHAHVVLIFSKRAPYIANATLAALWGHGFVSVKALTDIDNVGLYLSAYMADMQVAEALSCGPLKGGTIKAVQSADESGGGQTKAVVKGARLKLYPPGFKLFRHSRGIRYPQVWTCTEESAMQTVGDAQLTFQKAIRLLDGDKIINEISYRHYNRFAKGGGT